MFNRKIKLVFEQNEYLVLVHCLMEYRNKLLAENRLTDAMSGEFFETWVISEIYKSYINNGKRPSLYFYRDSNKKEIYVILHQNNTVYPIEIKKSVALKDAVKNFSVLKPIENEPSEEDRFSGAVHLKTVIGSGTVICLASDVLPIDNKNWYIPAWLI